jgi:hypothetical protein
MTRRHGVMIKSGKIPACRPSAQLLVSVCIFGISMHCGEKLSYDLQIKLIDRFREI